MILWQKNKPQEEIVEILTHAAFYAGWSKAWAASEGIGLSSTDSSIADICTGADVLDGLEIRGSVAQNSQDEALTAITDWLDKIEILDEN